MKRLAKLFLLLTVAVTVTAAAVAGWGYRSYHRPSSNLETVELIIAPGTSLTAIGRMLEENGLVADARVFLLGARLDKRHKRLTAGEYAFPPQTFIPDILEKLAEHDVIQRSVTVPEGLTSHEVVALLKATPILEGALSGVPEEGSLLPETYRFTRGTERETMLARMEESMRALETALWETRAADLPISSWREAVILASIVEKETGVDGERGKVAGVFMNRLRKGMRLQSDPTVVYGITRGQAPLGRRLLRSDLRAKSDYNTYTIDGLPPGPITNPGRESILAVLNPTVTDALYFVADGTGGHAFAKTLSEHNRNVAKWRRLQRQREQ